jgi:hypothetical protein
MVCGGCVLRPVPALNLSTHRRLEPVMIAPTAAKQAKRGTIVNYFSID